MLSFEDGLKEMIADGTVDKEQAEILLAAEEFAESESFEVPTKKVEEKHPWSELTAKQITKFDKDKVVEVAKELGVSIYKPNGKTIDTEINIAIRIVEKLS